MEQVTMNEWNGEWWAEGLEGNELAAYTAIVEKLEKAAPGEIPQIAKELFQLGHELGYKLGVVCSSEDY
jgi:hypothetical protein